MGDLLIALSAIAAAFVLYHRIRAAQALKRLAKLMAEQRATDPDHERAEEKEGRPSA